MMNKLNVMKILIAEDNMVSAAYLKELLVQDSTKVEIVTDGFSAHKAAIENNYDLIFMDYQMPGMSGTEATKQIKIDLNNLGKPLIPVIACCATDNVNEKKIWNQLGVENILLKPVSVEALNEVMKGYKNIGFNTDDSDDKTIKHHEGKTLYSLDKLIGMSRGNNEFVTKMINLFVTETPSALNNINSHIAAQDFQRVRAIIHRIKPSLKMLSIDSIEREVQKIEDCCLENINLTMIPDLFKNIDRTCNLVIEKMKQEKYYKK